MSCTKLVTPDDDDDNDGNDVVSPSKTAIAKYSALLAYYSQCWQVGEMTIAAADMQTNEGRCPL